MHISGKIVNTTFTLIEIEDDRLFTLNVILCENGKKGLVNTSLTNFIINNSISPIFLPNCYVTWLQISPTSWTFLNKW